MRARRGAGGATLLEALIALAIVAIGLTAALRASGVGIEGTLEYRSRLLALWLAEDAAAEARARLAWPDPGTHRREDEMGGQRFVVSESVSATASPRFRRLELQVAAAGEPQRVLRRLVVFLVRPG